MDKLTLSRICAFAGAAQLGALAAKAAEGRKVRPMTGYNFAFLDEGSKWLVRRALLKTVAIPGYQAPFGSRELPMGRGWGTGGIQITLSIIGRKDVLKVIDQGSDDSVNAVSIRNFVSACTGTAATTDSEEAAVIQPRPAPLRRGPGKKDLRPAALHQV